MKETLLTLAYLMIRLMSEPRPLGRTQQGGRAAEGKAFIK